MLNCIGMKETIDTVEYASLLYDFYGDLLDEGKREVMDLYHGDDLSLTEIAEEMNMTRQGVHYILKKAENTLERYEERLGLIHRWQENRVLGEKALAAAESLLASKELDEEQRSKIAFLRETVRQLTE